jgi:competence protein ComEA
MEPASRPRLIAALVTVFLFGLGTGVLLVRFFGQVEPLTVRLDDGAVRSAAAGSPIRVYVTGAVPAPGVYALHEGDRVVDAVELAGGPSADADTEAINFAQRLHDEDHFEVPRVGEAAAAAPRALTASASATAAALVDLNRADVNLLRSLPGIGSTRAGNIVTSRQKDGLFKTTDDLIRRKLVTQSIYDQVKGLIQVAP